VLRISRGFIAALFGIGMTLLAWFGSWAWPGWPASVSIDLLEKFASFPDLPQLAKAMIVILLIIINVGTWAALIRLAMLLLPRTSTSTARS
jgi:hypothetical protein